MGTGSLLKQIPLFKGLSKRALSELSARMRPLSVKKGETIFRKGSEGTTLYVILEGSVKIVLPSRLGDEMIVTIFKKGDFMGEMALLDQMPRSADAVAMASSKLLLLNRGDFLEFLRNSEKAIATILSALSKRLRKTDNLLQDTCFLSIKARLAKKLLEIGEEFGHRDGNMLDVNLFLTQKDLADMIGATRESINKELRTLRESGIVSFADKVLSVNDLDRLKRRIL